MSDNTQTSTDTVFDKLLKERITWLGEQVDDEITNKLCGQMLFLVAEDPRPDISLCINPPGGSVITGMTIYDAIQFVPCDVATHGMDPAVSMGQFPPTAGAKGKWYAPPHARTTMYQPSAGIGDTVSGITTQAEQLAAIKKEMTRLVVQHIDQPAERIEGDLDRDRWLIAAEAREYGLVDHVVTALKGTAH